MRQGRKAALGIGRRDVDFGLDGMAAAITKVEECRAHKGAASSGAAAGPEPADLVDSIYRSAMEGRDVLGKRNPASQKS